MQSSTPPQVPSARMLRHAAVTLMLAAALLAGASVAGPAVAAEEGTPWEIGTVDGSFGSGRQNYDYAVEPGERLEDALMIVNDGTTPLELTLYGADAFTTDAGQLDLRTRDDESSGVGAWLELDRDRIALQPGESAEVPFAVTVPDDAEPGSHLGGVVTAPASTSSNDSEPERRVALTVHLRVGESFRPSLSVEDVRVEYSGDALGSGLATVDYTVRNTGDTILAAEQTVAVAGPFGSFGVTAGPVANTPRLLPGEAWRVSAPVADVIPSGLLASTVTLVPLYTDPAGSTGPLTAVAYTGNGWAIPWLALMLVVVVVGAFAALVIVRRRARRSRRP